MVTGKGKGGDDGKGKGKGKGKGEGDEGDEEGRRKYIAHPEDRHWDEVGKRAKLVVDNQAVAMLLNRKAVCKNEGMKHIIRRCLNWQYGWLETF